MQNIVNSSDGHPVKPVAAEIRKKPRVRVQVFLDPAEIAAVEQLAAGASHSERLRNFVRERLPRSALSADPKAAPDAAPPVAGETRRTTLRLPTVLMAALQQRAKAIGLRPAWWLGSLIQTHLTGAPVMTTTELFGLREASRELAAIGRNLNQLTRAANEMVLLSPGKWTPMDASMVLEIAPKVEAVRREIRKLVLASQRMWDGNDFEANDGVD